MAFDDKNQSKQGGMNKNQQNQGGPDRNNPNTPAGTTPIEGQTADQANNMDNEQELDEQGKATGQMSNQKESNRMAGTTTSGNSGN